MATIKSQLQLNDAMTSVLRKMNSALLTCLDSFDAMQKASGNAINVENISAARSQLIGINGELAEINDGQKRVNDSLSQGVGLSDTMLGKIAKMAAAYLSVQSAINFVNDSLEAAFESQNINTQLAVSLKNMGLGKNAYDQLKDAAKDYGMYTQTAMTAAAAEFATYMSDADAIENMMGTLADYATGMAVTEGLDLSTADIADYATQLGKVLNGTFDGIAKKGFEVSDAQKKIIESGTDMEKAAVVADIINESWAGMYECMANTPEGKLLTLQNTINQMKEDMGTALLPVVMQLVDTIQANLPTIQQLIFGVTSVLNVIIPILASIINAVFSVAQYFIDNWSRIEPIITPIAVALGIVTAGLLAYKVAMVVASAAQRLFNSALLASPLTWILIVIIAIVAAIYIVIGVINKVTGSTISATGIIVGALATAGAFIWNLVLGLLELVLNGINYLVNPILAFANFFGNVFTDPIGSIIHLFGDLADNVLGYIQKIASALDLVFGSNMADTVQGWRNSLNSMVDTAAKKYGNGQYEEIVSALNLSVEGLGLSRIKYSDAWNAGYGAGEGIDNTMRNLFSSNDSIADDMSGVADILAGNDGIAGIADSAGSAAASLKDTTEDLKYLRDIAEQEAINRFTTAEVKIDMTGMTNRIESDMDLDGVLTVFTEGFAEALEIAAEGVHA